MNEHRIFLFFFNLIEKSKVIRISTVEDFDGWRRTIGVGEAVQIPGQHHGRMLHKGDKRQNCSIHEEVDITVKQTQ